ncbi:MAG: hypothetical protein RIG62_27185 [Cyclobacteriaceae bacterium]
MMNQDGGIGMHGGGWMWLLWILVAVVLVLLIVWLVKQIRN